MRRDDDADAELRKEQWESVVPDELRERLLFRSDVRHNWYEEYAKYPGPTLHGWAMGRLRTIQTIYQLAEQFRTHWSELKNHNHNHPSPHLDPSAPLHLALAQEQNSLDQFVFLEVQPVWGITRSLCSVGMALKYALPPHIPVPYYGAEFSRAVGHNYWWSCTKSDLETMSHLTALWNDHVRDRVEDLPLTHRKAFRSVMGRKMPDVYGLMGSLHDLGVRSVKMKGTFDPAVHNDHARFSKRGTVYHQDDRSFEMHLTVNPHPLEDS